MPFKPNVAIIILNWNGFNDTAECLNSLKELDYPGYKIGTGSAVLPKFYLEEHSTILCSSVYIFR
jgi:hypothetical protein